MKTSMFRDQSHFGNDQSHFGEDQSRFGKRQSHFGLGVEATSLKLYANRFSSLQAKSLKLTFQVCKRNFAV